MPVGDPALSHPARVELLGRAREAVWAATRVPSPDPAGSLAALDDALATARRGAAPADPGLRAVLLRHGLLARLVLAAAPDIEEAWGARGVEAGVDDLFDELLGVVGEHGLSLFGADAQVLLARRALLDGDEDGALSAVSTALSQLEEPSLVDLAATAAEHRHNLQCSRRMAASTLVSLSMHDIAESQLDQARTLAAADHRDLAVGPHGAGDYERVRVGVSWGLRLERAGRHGGERMWEAAGVAAAIQDRASVEQKPLLRAAGVLARTTPTAEAAVRAPRPDGPVDRSEVHLVRREVSTLSRARSFASQHDRLLAVVARARALETSGNVAAAVATLDAVRDRPPRGEPSLMLTITRELARLRTGLASGCDAPNAAAKAALRRYTEDLEAELWALHQARVLSLRTRLAHDRLRREHGQVTALALADPLTGLPNRRALDRALDEHLARGASTPLAVAMVDVDGFKQINDRVSHARGDEVLRLVAAALRSSLRAPDVVARYGGDEFVVVLPGASAADAGAALGRAARTVTELPHGPDGRAVTLSVGVVAAWATETAAEVLARADAVMYAAKRAGGNAVRVRDGALAGTGGDSGAAARS